MRSTCEELFVLAMQVSDLINSSKLTDDDRLRLVMLFALKYERDGRPQVELNASRPYMDMDAEPVLTCLASMPTRSCLARICGTCCLVSRMRQSRALAAASKNVFLRRRSAASSSGARTSACRCSRWARCGRCCCMPAPTGEALKQTHA